MYKAIVRRKTVGVFDALNSRDCSVLLRGLAPKTRHIMYGDHSLGGARTTKRAIEAWYGRLARLFPDLHFDVSSVVVAGPPWRTKVAVIWSDRAQDGNYANQGVNVIDLRFGKVQAVAVHCDTQRLCAALSKLAADGLEEAAASPVTDDSGPG